MRTIVLLSFLGLLIGINSVARADELKVDVAEQGPTITKPSHGITKEKVEQQFGEPQQKIDAVGEPPISRWIYSQFTVYFERNRVIHAVTHPSGR